MATSTHSGSSQTCNSWRFCEAKLFVDILTERAASQRKFAGFQAACSGTTCTGSYNGNTFTFNGPFTNAPPYNPFIDFSIGTNGGAFTYGGNTCDHGVPLGGGNCYGEVAFGANIGPPDPAGYSLGAVV